MTICIHGASDDGVIVEGCPGADEFDAYELSAVAWRGDLIAPGGDAMRVHAVFDGGCWSFAIGQADDVIPFPEWPVRIRQHTNRDYSVLVEIDAPPGTRLDNVSPKPRTENS
jgi:hypothetical protein